MIAVGTKCIWGRGVRSPAFTSIARGHMSVQAISWVLEHSESRLGARHVLISIANNAKSDGTGAWPSVSTISHEARLSEREVRYALRELEKSRELLTDHGGGPRGCNMYSLPMMGQTLQGQKRTVGGQNTTAGGQNRANIVSDFAPEPSFEPSRTVKEPKTKEAPRFAWPNWLSVKNRRLKATACYEGSNASLD